MKRLLVPFAILLTAGVFTLAVIVPYFTATADRNIPEDGREPDLPPGSPNVDKADFMLRRAEYIGLKRGVDKDKPVDPRLRQTAIAQMERQEAAVAARPASSDKESLLAAWTPIGPAPIPNGQVVSGPQTPVSGRVTAISVHPTNPNIVYVGTAQGGVYRTLDGGTSWTPLLDTAMSLAIGAVTIDTGAPETVYVGTGEANFGGDTFFGVGVYRIDNASTSATVNGPFNLDNRQPANDVFSGRSISEIAVYPFLPGQIYVSTTRGLGGIGGSLPNATPGGAPLGRRGIWRSDNITSDNPTFRQIGIYSGCGGVGAPLVDMNVRDIAIDPTNADRMFATVTWEFANAALRPLAGVYAIFDHRSTALSAGTSCARIFPTDASNFDDDSAELTIHHSNASGPRMVYVARGIGNGQLWRSVGDFDSPWTMVIDNNFCGDQCSYNIAVAVDPTNVNRVYLGGVTSASHPGSLTFGISTNAAMASPSFTPSETSLHTDSHVITVAPSQPSTIYFGSDGGIYKSTNSGATWTSLNNATFSATQFMSVAVHPTDPNFTLGGTQDNGTNFYQPQGAWTRTDGGDGGYAVIDQNATDTTNVRQYHTYFNQIGPPATAAIGYARRPNTTALWTSVECDRLPPPAPQTGISCSDTAVLFYAPLEPGPGNPNTIYYGTDRLYRSADGGATHTLVSQAPIQATVPISAIGISPQNDAVRIVGLSNGVIAGTTNGSAAFRDFDPNDSVPNNFIARAVIDPNNVNVAYVTLSRFGTPGTPNVWRTANLNATPPNWTAASGPGVGAAALPAVPVNAFLVDPTNSATLYAGTDIGVYISTNSGSTWAPFGTGLPRVAVFDMAITGNRDLRIATHGRGMYDMPLGGEAQRSISINDVSANEGNAGTTAFNFTVSLSAASTQTVTVNFTTANGTATAGSDYVANSGAVTFNPGETSKTVTIQVNGDTVSEPNETFNVILSGAVNGTIADGTGVGTIVDDDQAALSITDVTLTEGNTGTKAFNFNVTLSRASSQTVSVNFATANGSATAGIDYFGSNGSVSFSPGETTKTVTVTVNGDSDVEPDETFFVNLSGATNASIADNQGQGLIQNDDFSVPSLSINDVSLNEGNTGTTAFNFTVNLTPVSSQVVTVNYATANGTAIAPGDYVAVGSTLLTFGAGVASQQVTILVNGDTTIEAAETFTVNLSNPSNAALSDPVGLGTIQNDDGAQPGISINDISLNEGNTGTTPFNFTVTLSAPTAQTVTVSYATASGTALFPVDFNNITATTLTFNPNETSKQIQVNVNGDTLLEPNETFFVNLSNPTNATITDNQGMATILNDDTCSYQINPTSQNFGSNGGTGTVQVITQAGCAWTAVSNGAASLDDALNIFDLPERIDVFDVKRTENTIESPAVVFPGTGVGAIPDGLSGTPPQYGAARVISFNVSGITGPITAISPSITLTHTWVGDVDMVLRSPGGATSLITVSRIGATTDNPFGTSSDYSGTYNFSDTATSANIWIAADNTPVPAGTYRTTAGGGPGQTDPPPVTSLLATFGPLTSAQINGTWTLSVRDGAADDTGSVSAASLDITGTTGGGGFVGITSGSSGNGNGNVNYTVGPNTTGAARTTTMTIAGQTFTINQSTTPTASVQKGFDYDGDGRADISIYRPSIGDWYVQGSQNGLSGIRFGLSTDRIVPADFDGDGKTDVAVYRPSDGTWYIVRSTDGTFMFAVFGLANDLPVPGDFDGDGRADISVFRPSDSTWYRLNSSNGSFFGRQFGAAGDKPVMGDFDGDGRADLAVFRASAGAWFQIRSQNDSFFGEQFGTSTDQVVPADYDGDRKTDLAVYRASNGFWYIKPSLTGVFSQTQFGAASDIPAPADYDGDGRADICVFRPSEGQWYRLNSSNGMFDAFPFGVNGDRPTQSAFQ